MRPAPFPASRLVPHVMFVGRMARSPLAAASVREIGRGPARRVWGSVGARALGGLHDRAARPRCALGASSAASVRSLGLHAPSRAVSSDRGLPGAGECAADGALGGRAVSGAERVWGIPPPAAAGRLELILGPMFSGKTSELLRRAGDASGAPVLLLKSALDDRYGVSTVASHDGSHAPCFAVRSLLRDVLGHAGEECEEGRGGAGGRGNDTGHGEAGLDEKERSASSVAVAEEATLIGSGPGSGDAEPEPLFSSPPPAGISSTASPSSAPSARSLSGGASSRSSSPSCSSSSSPSSSVPPPPSPRALYASAHTIAIDEGQFFSDLEAFSRIAVGRDRKRVVVAALSGDFRMASFGQAAALAPFADRVEYLAARCVLCGDGTPAPFTARRPQAVDASSRGGEESQTLVGGGESYVPVCRAHHRQVTQEWERAVREKEETEETEETEESSKQSPNTA